jgi:excisionase family DNA binding protein
MGMLKGQNDPGLDELLDRFADRLANKVADKLEERGFTALMQRPRLLTVEQAAAYLGRTPAAIQHMIQSGKLPVVRIDRRVAIDVNDLERLVETKKTGAELSRRRLQ